MVSGCCTASRVARGPSFSARTSIQKDRPPSAMAELMWPTASTYDRLNRAAVYTHAPKIIMIETDEERGSRDEKGRPISVGEMAKLFAAATEPNLFIFLLLLANTLARPGALFDLRRQQFDADHNLLNLNPKGRKQNKKHRPIVPVTSTLRPWLELVIDPQGYYIHRLDSYARIYSLDPAWNRMRNKAGLHDVTPYSFRHGMSRELRKRRVPLEEIKLFLGHKPLGSDKTTEIYAPFDPDYCTNAREAIDDVMSQIVVIAKLQKLDSPGEFLASLTMCSDAQPSRFGLTTVQQGRLRECLVAGMTLRAVKHEFGISTTTVAKYRKKFGLPDARKRRPC